MPTRSELKERRSALSRTWEAVFGGGSGAGDLAVAVDDDIVESWRRSSAHVSPDVDAAPTADADAAVADWRQTPIAHALKAVEDDVCSVAEDGDLVAAVTDRTGRIVWSHGGRVMSRAAERVNFVPGGCWDEASVGTNALALALRTGKPSTVYSAEHFSRAVHGWVCYSVALQEPTTGEILGVLDLSTTWDRAHPLALRSAQLLGQLVTAALPRPRTDSAPAPVELSVLGRAELRVDGRVVLVPQRQLEILTLLALHPEGLSLEQLHGRLYGDARVTTTTLKSEISHLRSALGGGIGSRPYRLTVEVDSDLQRALRALDRGEVVVAGTLLPQSESPDILEWRDYLEVAQRTAALASDDARAVLALADAEPYDLELQQHLVDLLREDDPRRAAARARLQRATNHQPT